MRKLSKIKKPEILTKNACTWNETLLECIKQGKEIPNNIKKNIPIRILKKHSSKKHTRNVLIVKVLLHI